MMSETGMPAPPTITFDDTISFPGVGTGQQQLNYEDFLRQPISNTSLPARVGAARQWIESHGAMPDWMDRKDVTSIGKYLGTTPGETPAGVWTGADIGDINRGKELTEKYIGWLQEQGTSMNPLHPSLRPMSASEPVQNLLQYSQMANYEFDEQGNIIGRHLPENVWQDFADVQRKMDAGVIGSYSPYYEQRLAQGQIPEFGFSGFLGMDPSVKPMDEQERRWLELTQPDRLPIDPSDVTFTSDSPLAENLSLQDQVFAQQYNQGIQDLVAAGVDPIALMGGGGGADFGGLTGQYGTGIGQGPGDPAQAQAVASAIGGGLLGGAVGLGGYLSQGMSLQDALQATLGIGTSPTEMGISDALGQIGGAIGGFPGMISGLLGAFTPGGIGGIGLGGGLAGQDFGYGGTMSGIGPSGGQAG